MTRAIAFPCWVVGLMSGTSADGVDAALLYTDGREIVEIGPSLTIPYSDQLRIEILGLMQGIGDLRATQESLTQVHIEAVEKLRERSKEKISLIGFHGQTITHQPARRMTVQIGDAKQMAEKTGVAVIADFRSRDMREGGQGAPLVPLYQAALATKLPKPLMVVNIGGVANVTWIGNPIAGKQDHIVAFDSGPGNALMDDWFHRHTGERFDQEGRAAARGKIDERRLTEFLNDPYFSRPAPKSLDRNHFSLALVEGLGLEDGMATLAAMTAFSIAKSFAMVPQIPEEMLVTGGGRHNVTLLQLIKRYCGLVGDGDWAAPSFADRPKSLVASGEKFSARLRLRHVDEVGWNGDALEAQAFAYLAARSMQGLSLTLPTTTGVRQPVTGGVFYPPGRAA